MALANSIGLLLLCALYSPHVALVNASLFWRNSDPIRPVEARLDLNATHVEPVFPADAKPEDVSRFKEWQKSSFYAPSFDPKVITIPEAQREFTRKQTRKSHELFKEIVEEAIRIRNGIGAGSRLMLKYSIKLLSTFMQMRREESKIKPRLEPKGEFFERLADLIEYVLNESARIKKEKGYNKKNVDVEDFRQRTSEIFDYILKVLTASPVGGYLKFETMSLHMDDVKNPRHGRKLLSEAADLTAQFRGIGYESTIFVGKRLAKLMRLFAKGKVPDRADDV